MPSTCIIRGCGHTYATPCKLYRVPIEPRRRSQWQEEIRKSNGINYYVREHHRVCNCHFSETQFETRIAKDSKKERCISLLKPKAVPTETSKLKKAAFPDDKALACLKRNRSSSVNKCSLCCESSCIPGEQQHRFHESPVGLPTNACGSNEDLPSVTSDCDIATTTTNGCFLDVLDVSEEARDYEGNSSPRSEESSLMDQQNIILLKESQKTSFGCFRKVAPKPMNLPHIPSTCDLPNGPIPGTSQERSCGSGNGREICSRPTYICPARLPSTNIENVPSPVNAGTPLTTSTLPAMPSMKVLLEATTSTPTLMAASTLIGSAVPNTAMFPPHNEVASSTQTLTTPKPATQTPQRILPRCPTAQVVQTPRGLSIMYRGLNGKYNKQQLAVLNKEIMKAHLSNTTGAFTLPATINLALQPNPATVTSPASTVTSTATPSKVSTANLTAAEADFEQASCTDAVVTKQVEKHEERARPSLPPLSSEEQLRLALEDRQCNIVTTGQQEDDNILKLEVAKLKRRIYTLSKRNTMLSKKYDQLKSNFDSLFNEDQMQYMATGRVRQWSKETMQFALQTRFIVGVNGYNYLCKKLPLPSYATLCRRVQKMPLDTGISKFTLDLMKIKSTTLDVEDLDVAIGIDEMSLDPQIEYDGSQKKVIGKTTLGNISEDATHLLLLVARGIRKKWKQIIGFELTCNTAPTAADLKNFVHTGIKGLEDAGYKVCSFVSDMGPVNKILWKAWGLKVDRENFIHSIPHPVRQNEKLFIMADLPHLLKNIRSGVMKYDLQLPENILQKHNLSHDTISFSWVQKLVVVCRQNENAENENPNNKSDTQVFDGAFHLTKEVMAPDNFQTMRVCYARAIFCDRTFEVMTRAIKRGLLPEEAETTAWFIKLVSDWYELATSRHRKCSITRKNEDEKINFLYSVIEVFRNLKIHSGWKPYQTGVILSTLSAIGVSKYLLKTNEFVLLGRFTQDHIENLFSIVRARGSINPSPLQALRATRLIAMSQFTKEIKSSNYEDGDDKPFLDFLSTPIKKQIAAPKSHNLHEVPTDVPKFCELYDFGCIGAMESDVLSDFAGFILRHTKRKMCENCLTFCKNDDDNENTFTKDRDKGGLNHANLHLIETVKVLELVCAEHMLEVMFEENVVDLLSEKCIKEVVGQILPECQCNFAVNFCTFFVHCRTIFLCKKINQKSKMERKKKAIHSSKSANDQTKRRRLNF